MLKHLGKRWLVLAFGLAVAGVTMSSCKHNSGSGNGTTAGISHSGQSVVTVKGANS